MHFEELYENLFVNTKIKIDPSNSYGFRERGGNRFSFLTDAGNMYDVHFNELTSDEIDSYQELFKQKIPKQMIEVAVRRSDAGARAGQQLSQVDAEENMDKFFSTLQEIFRHAGDKYSAQGYMIHVPHGLRAETAIAIRKLRRNYPKIREKNLGGGRRIIILFKRG